MIRIDQSVQDDIARTQQALQAVKDELAETGQGSVWMLALLQMNRFVGANIEVDTGRTKNSVFTEVSGSGNGITALLGTNVSYSPFVRDAGHNKQFFEYAAETEGPAIAQLLGDEVAIRVEGAFS